MTGAWNTNATGGSRPNGPTLTVGAIKAMADKMPPKQTFVSSVLFPSTQAWHFRRGREDFTCAAPSFWSAAFAHAAQTVDLQAPPFDPYCWAPYGLRGVTVLDIDLVTTDRPDLAEWRARQRKRVMLAVCDALGQVFDEEALS